MRPNPAGWFIVAFFLIGGIVFTVTLPWVGIGQIWIVVALGLAGLYLFLMRKGARAARLRSDGIAGEATILGIEQTSTQINNQPVVKLRLRVEAPGVAAFEAEKREVVPLVALATLGTGQPLPVFLDRANPQEFTIDWGIAAAPMTISQQDGPPISVTTPAARQAVLRTLREQGVDLANADLRQNPRAREAVLRALGEHGLGPYARGGAGGAATASAGVAADAGAEQGEPLERLQQLMDLKAKQLITDEEFARHRDRILSDM